MPGEASGIEDLLKEDVGGVPAWGIGAVLAAGVVGYVYLKNRKAAAADTSSDSVDGGTADASSAGGTGDPYPPDGTTDDPSDPYSTDSSTGSTYGDEASGGTTGGYGAGIADYLQSDPTNPDYPVGLSPQGLPGPVTNTQWARLAADYLLGQGDDPTLVNNALNAFVNGQPLTQAEQAIVNLALQTFGEPPQGVKPVMGGAPVPNKTKDIKVPRNETLAQMRARTGHWSSATYKSIQELNNISPSTKLKKGQELKRPA